MHVHTLASARGAPSEALQRTVLLGRDVLDALVLDVARRHSMRANDLWLRADDGELRLRAADVSPWAVLRRLGRGWLGRGAERRLVDWRDVEFLRGDPNAAVAGGDYHRRIARLGPSAVALLAEQVPYRHATELLTLVPPEVAADVLALLPPPRELQVFHTLEPQYGVRLLGLMPPRAAAALLGRTLPTRAEWYLGRLEPTHAERIVELLRYPEDTAGGVMTNDVPMVAADLNVGQARAALVDQLQTQEFAYYVYVVETLEAAELRGVVSLRDLLVAAPEVPLRELMSRDMVVLDPLQSAQSAAQRVVEEHRASLPVVGANRRLLGAVTFDSALAQLAPAAWREHTPRIFS